MIQPSILGEDLSEIAWKTVESFLKLWQQSPYRWSTEIDVQVELASRLLDEYRKIGKDTVIGNYKGAIAGFEHHQAWNRVCSEPKIYFKNGDFCYPDVVVWDNIVDQNSPPDSVEGYNWPIIWLCEIKLDWSDKSGWDQQKLELLLAEATAMYGCRLELFRERDTHGSGLHWDPPSGNFRSCRAKLPALVNNAPGKVPGTAVAGATRTGE